MKRILTCIFAMAHCYFLTAQSVGIGNPNPHSSAILDLSSINKGLIIPRMTGAQRVAIPDPVAGMIVYQTNNESASSTYGYYMHYGGGAPGGWRRMARADEIIAGASSWTVSGNNQYSNVAGNVGIGLNAAINEKFTLKGNALITFANAGDLVNGGANASLRLMGAGTGSSNILFLDPDSTPGGKIFYSPIFDVLTVANGYNADSRINFYDNGNLGLGTSGLSNAISKLQIEGGDFIDLDNHHGYIMMGTQGSLNMALGRYGIQARDNNAAAGLYLQQSGGPVRIGNGGAEQTRLQIMSGFTASLTSNGYLLLGGHTQQSLAFSNNNIQSRNNGVAADLHVQNYGGDFKVQQNTLVVSNAKVGIGTLTPDEKLHVMGNAILNATDANIQLQSNSIEKGFMQLSGDNIRIGTNSGNTNGKFVIRTNGGDRFFVDGNGNVNIGSQTDAPGYLLRVDGRMICEEVKVKLSTAWPDYVFNDNHALMSIHKLSKFIQANKHLPNIPSAKEVEKNGIEIGDMQKRMMEKIEELTLYIIQQQNEMDELKILIKSNK